MREVGGITGSKARIFWEKKVNQDHGVHPGSPVWSSIYCTIRDRRRSKSQASMQSLSRSDTSTSVSSGRTTPSPGLVSRMNSRSTMEDLVSASRRTETATPIRSKSEGFLASLNDNNNNNNEDDADVKHPLTAITSKRYQTTCYLQPKTVPVRFSSTVVLRLNSSKRKYVEQINFQTRLVPQRYTERVTTTRSEVNQLFSADLTIPCDLPLVYVVSLEALQAKCYREKLAGGMQLTEEAYL